MHCLFVDWCLSTDAPGPTAPSFSGFQVAHLLLFLCMCYFGYFMFFVVFVYFPSLVFIFGVYSFDYISNFGSIDYSLMIIVDALKNLDNSNDKQL